MRSQVIIPVRLNSKRLPGKALLRMAGKTLVQHVWERAVAARLDCEPIIATDSPEVAREARGFGAQVSMTSPGHHCGSERVAEVAEHLDAEVIINLQGDEVRIDPGLIVRLPQCLADSAVQMATAVFRLREHVAVEDKSLVKAVLNENGNVLYFSRNPIPYFQDPAAAQPCYYGHLGIYAFRRSFLLEVYRRPLGNLELAEGLEQLRVLEAGFPIRAVVWEAEHCSINTPADFERIRGQIEGEGVKGAD